MKTTYSSHSELAHVWANNFDASKFGKASNMFFDNLTIYSYGKHFVLGTKINIDGVIYTFLNTNGYSNSTAKHKTHVWRAVRNQPNVFEIPFLTNNVFYVHQLPEIIDNLKDEVSDLLKKQINAKTNHWTFASAWSNIGKIQNICKTFNLPMVNESDFENWEEARKKAYLLRETEAARKEKQREVEVEKEKELLLKWIKNEYHGTLYNSPIHLRFADEGKTIQTSHGAKVPTKEVYLLLTKLRNGQDCKGEKIGQFTLIESTLDYVKIGCHTIKWEVINNFFKV